MHVRIQRIGLYFLLAEKRDRGECFTDRQRGKHLFGYDCSIGANDVGKRVEGRGVHSAVRIKSRKNRVTYSQTREGRISVCGNYLGKKKKMVSDRTIKEKKAQVQECLERAVGREGGGGAVLITEGPSVRTRSVNHVRDRFQQEFGSQWLHDLDKGIGKRSLHKKGKG